MNKVGDTKKIQKLLMSMDTGNVPIVEALITYPMSRLIYFVGNDCGYKGTYRYSIANK